MPLIYIGGLAAFVADLFRTNTLAYGVAYIPLIGTALLSRHRWMVSALTGASIVMIAIGAVLPAVDPDLPDLISNRLLSILAILATAVLVNHARSIQDRLAAATRRAETAERIRTDVLSNLGREMRTPLHTLMAMLGLLLTNCRDDQREALGKMRAGGRQLLLTLDNLIDLTQIDARTLHPIITDIAAMLRSAIGEARTVAADSGVAIEVSRHLCRSEEAFDAFVDPQVTRRIVDNLLYNAIRLTQRSRSICVAIRQDHEAVIVTVGNSGEGMPDRLVAAEPADPGAVVTSLLTPTVGVGLTLGRRLAEAMDGRLSVETLPGIGTIVSLRLPLAPAPQPA